MKIWVKGRVRTLGEPRSTLNKVSDSYNQANYHPSTAAPLAHPASAVRKIVEKAIGKMTKRHYSTIKKNDQKVARPSPHTTRPSQTHRKSAHLPSAYEVLRKHLDHEGRDKGLPCILLYYSSFYSLALWNIHTIPPLSLAFLFLFTKYALEAERWGRNTLCVYGGFQVQAVSYQALSKRALRRVTSMTSLAFPRV
jgi:hypothetical protein